MSALAGLMPELRQTRRSALRQKRRFCGQLLPAVRNARVRVC